MTRMVKAVCLRSEGADIVWEYRMGKNGKPGRIFFIQVNGQKFKKTLYDQMIAGEIIDEMFGDWWEDDVELRKLQK